MRTKFKTISLLVLLLLSSILFAQNRKELEDKRKRLIQEINQTTGLLNQTKKDKKATLGRYLALQKQIRKRQQLINTLQEEIKYTNSSIQRANEVVESLKGDIDQLKSEYTSMLRIAYRHKKSYSAIIFLFSANNFNDAFKRWRLLKRYDAYRKKQAELIFETQRMLVNRVELLKTKKNQKEKLLGSEKRQKELLSQELKDKDQILETLKADESRLASDLLRQQAAHQKLNDAIESIIQKEITRKRKESRTSEALASRPSNSIALSSTISDDFQKRRGRLPWPVANGTIVRQFGKQPHPTLKEIEITNNGIDIQTDNQSEVQAVFDGKVAGTQFIPGYQNTVILQHGKYYTVYSNLQEVYVKRGDIVQGKQAIGQVGKQKSEVHFEIWKEKQRMDPMKWVVR